MKSKTIILSSSTNEKGRGILTIYKEDDLLHCKIRLYNVDGINRYCKLGVYHNEEVFSGNLLEKNGVYTSSLVGNFNMDIDFYTAIIDTSQGNKVLLSGGTYSGYFMNDDSVFKKQEKRILNNVEKEDPITNLYDYTTQQIPDLLTSLEIENPEKPLHENVCRDDDCHNEILTGNEKFETILSNETCQSDISPDCDKCAHCKYKEYFYSHQENVTAEITQNSNQKEENLTTKTEQTKPSILSSIIPQFDYVFKNFPMDETLIKLIPNSKFVKINENHEQYSIGAIYQNDEMKYICYAVFKTYNTPAPEEIGEHYQWLPIDNEDPLSDGYYVVFQDTADLKIVEL